MVYHHGTAKANTSDTIEVTVVATDEDKDDMLTYTLWYGETVDNITTKGVSSSPTKQGTSVKLTQTGLPKMDTTYYFKVIVSDTLDEATSAENSAKTLCKGTYCSGGYYTYPTCTSCNGSGKKTCTTCNGNKRLNCSSCGGSGKVSCLTSYPKTCTNTEFSPYTVNYNCSNGCGEKLKVSGQYCNICHRLLPNPSTSYPSSTCPKSTTGRHGFSYSSNTNKHPGIINVKCTICNGTGTTACSNCRSSGWILCSYCTGDGAIPCNTCYGNGTTETSNNCTHGNGPYCPHYYCSTHTSSTAEYH